MGRIVKTIEIEGHPAVTLFDTGATYSYTRAALVENVAKVPVPTAHMVLGGQHIDIHEMAIVTGKMEGLPFFTDTVPVQSLGRADGQELDAIIGARAMEQWEIRLDPKSGELDLEGLRRREFTEFTGVGEQ